MDKERVQKLRKTQRIVLNVFSLLYIAIIVGIIFLIPATRGEVYNLLAITLLASIIGQLVVYRSKPRTKDNLSDMQKLGEWERERLGDSWFHYYFPGMLLRGILTVYFFAQAGLYAGNTPFRSEIPFWYFIIIPLILIIVANANMTFHTRRMDTKTKEELKQYSQEKMLFTKIFAIVASVMAIIGFALVIWLR